MTGGVADRLQPSAVRSLTEFEEVAWHKSGTVVVGRNIHRLTSMTVVKAEMFQSLCFTEQDATQQSVMLYALAVN